MAAGQGVLRVYLLGFNKATLFLPLALSASFLTHFLSGYNEYGRLHWLLSDEKGTFSLWDLFRKQWISLFCSSQGRHREKRRRWSLSSLLSGRQSHCGPVGLYSVERGGGGGVRQEASVVTEEEGSSRIHSGSSGKLQNTQEQKWSLWTTITAHVDPSDTNEKLSTCENVGECRCFMSRMKMLLLNVTHLVWNLETGAISFLLFVKRTMGGASDWHHYKEI